MSSKISAYFTLTGNRLDPAEITKALGIPPDQTWRDGDSIQDTLLRRKHDGWSIYVTHAEAMATAAVLHALFDRIRDLGPKVRELARRFDLSVEVCCVVKTNARPAPVLHFDQTILSILAEFGAELDIDLYIAKDVKA